MHTYCKFRYAHRTVSVNTLDCSVLTDQLARHIISWVHSGWLTTQRIPVYTRSLPQCLWMGNSVQLLAAPYTIMHRAHTCLAWI